MSASADSPTGRRLSISLPTSASVVASVIDRAAKHRVLVKSDVSAAVDALGRAKRLVHANAAAFDGESERFRQIEIGIDAHSFEDQVGLFAPAIRERHPDHPASLAVPRLYGGAGAQV